jgi:hypothetical protein
MTTELETFVDSHRQELDVYIPSSALWTKINTGIEQQGIIAAKASWIKYLGYGALTVAAAVGITALVPKEPKTPKTVQQKVYTIPAAETVLTSQEIKNDHPQQTISSPIPELLAAPRIQEHELPAPELLQAPLSIAPAFMPIEAEPETLANAAVEDEEPQQSTDSDTSFTGIKRLEINVSSFDININSSSTGRLDIKNHMHTEVKGIVLGGKNIKRTIRYERKDSLLTITVDCSGKDKHIMLGGSINEDYRMEVQVPDNVQLVIGSKYGNVNINNIKTDICKVKTSSGDITLNNIQADLNVFSGYGNVNGANVEGKLDAEVVSGDLHLSNYKGEAKISSSYGNQLFNGIEGNMHLGSLSGDVKITNMKGDLSLKSTYGNINLNNYSGTPEIEVVSGDVGGKDIFIKDHITIKSNYGNIQMKFLNNQEDLSYDLKSSYGKITVLRDGKKLESENQLLIETGKILVKARSNSGDQSFK